MNTTTSTTDDLGARAEVRDRQRIAELRKRVKAARLHTMRSPLSDQADALEVAVAAIGNATKEAAHLEALEKAEALIAKHDATP